jgi:ParB-like chromosome segregation protein Spo0J
MTMHELRPIAEEDIPLEEIGLNPRFQSRMHIDEEWVQHLAGKTDHMVWDPVWVRRWPEGEARPPGCEHAVYEVASGFTRTTAARRIGLKTLRCAIYDCPDNGDFLVLAAQGNARHGARLTNEEQVRQAQRLRDAGKSQGDIAKALGLARTTISNWLSGRDTHAASKARGALSGQRDTDEAGVPASWSGAAPVSLDARQVAAIGITMGRALNQGDLTTTVPPAQARAWWDTQTPSVRRTLTGRVQQIAEWWQGLAAVAHALEREQEREQAQDHEQEESATDGTHKV